MSAGRKYKVHFTGFLEGAGTYDYFEFAIGQEPGGRAEFWKVEITRSLQMELANISTDFAALAARAIELHLLGKIPPDHYHEDKRKTICLTTNWYPGYPGQPEVIDDFAEFEVVPPNPWPGFKTH